MAVGIHMCIKAQIISKEASILLVPTLFPYISLSQCC